MQIQLQNKNPLKIGAMVDVAVAVCPETRRLTQASCNLHWCLFVCFVALGAEQTPLRTRRNSTNWWNKGCNYILTDNDRKWGEQSFR